MWKWDLYIYLVLASIFCYYVLPFKLTLGTVAAGAALFYFLLRDSGTRRYTKETPNPFKNDSRKPRQPYIHDQKKRDEVLKQSFKMEKVPNDLDAIVIGSGIGGLTTAVVMAKAGKKVLVLEQHDQAGGCCHTFIDKGYEFDVGIHYIGELSEKQINKTLVDQITDGQLQWEKLDKEFDVVSIGYGDDRKVFGVTSGEENWKAYLKEKFPKETVAIDGFFDLIKQASTFDFIMGALKLIPLQLALLSIRLGLIHLATNLWRGEFKKTTYEIISSLTDDPDLRTIFCYSWGDFGSPPSESHFLIQGLVHNHFMESGGYYPIGGASEIAFNMIPIIEKSGGKVLVRADVLRILFNGNSVSGVQVKKGSEVYEIHAPVVISNAGVYNTFQNLLPIEQAQKSYFTKLIREMKPGAAAFNIFIGLNASNEELGLKKQNIWCYSTNTAAFESDRFSNLPAEEAKDSDPPFIFISFPSAKDPEWSNHPGRKNKSTCVIVSLANWEWFQRWEDKPLKKRGDDYEVIKKTMADSIIEHACKLYPQIRHHIDYVEIGTPVTNKHYLAQPHGEIYGLDHNYHRLTPTMIAKLRPKTDISGLFLTGQDVFVCGFTGALFGGLLCAGTVLDRNTMGDLENLHKQIVGSD